VVVGICVGFVGAFAAILLSYMYSARVVDGSLDRNVVNSLIVRIVAALACVFSMVTMILMSKWAKDTSTDDTDQLYLGSPNWSSAKGLFAYHPVLMTSGFFVAQVFAAATWSLGKVRENAKLVHVLFQTAGLSTMIAGWVAIMEFQHKQDMGTLTTIHSWVGVAAVVCFGMNYFWGASMAILTMCFPNSVLRQGVDLRAHHKKLGIWSMFLSLAAVLTGIMNQLPQGSCLEEPESFSFDPSDAFNNIFPSCQYGMGIGMTAIAAVFCVLWAVADRGDSFAVPSTPSPPTISTSELEYSTSMTPHMKMQQPYITVAEGSSVGYDGTMGNHEQHHDYPL